MFGHDSTVLEYDSIMGDVVIIEVCCRYERSEKRKMTENEVTSVYASRYRMSHKKPTSWRSTSII